MSLLNRLFGSKKSIAKEFALDKTKIKQIWEDYLKSFEDKELCAQGISYKRPDEADPALVPQQLANNLERALEIEALLSRELVDVGAIERTEEEIHADLKRLTSYEKVRKLGDLALNYDKPVDDARAKKLLRELKEILTAEFQVIQLIKKDPAKAQEYQKGGLFSGAPETTFLMLRNLIIRSEARIVRALNADLPYLSFSDTARKKLKATVNRVLLGNATPPSKEPKGPSRESIDMARIIADQINESEPLLPDIIYNAKALTKIILAKYPKLSPEKVKEVITALRYNLHEPE